MAELPWSRSAVTVSTVAKTRTHRTPSERKPPLEAGVGSGLQGRCGGVAAGGATGNEVIGRGRPIWSDLAERWNNRGDLVTEHASAPPHLARAVGSADADGFDGGVDLVGG